MWFRGATREQANRLGITGYAKNLPDGRVEVLACGDDADLEILIEWLKHGPEMAHVTGLNIETVVIQIQTPSALLKPLLLVAA